MSKIKSDLTTLHRINTAHPVLRSELTGIYAEILNANVGVRFTSVYRSKDEQDDLYAQGRSKPGRIVTNARGGQSYHNYGLAIDFCLLYNGNKKVSWDRNKDLDNDGKKDWQEVVDIFKSYNWEWGGDWGFKDYPHFQKTFGYHWKELKNLPIFGGGYPKLKFK